MASSLNRIPPAASGAIRTFVYFLASGTHFRLTGVDYLYLYGNEPSAVEKTIAIFVNILAWDDQGKITNLKHADQRATDYLRSYCDSSFTMEPPLEDWEGNLY